MIVALVLHYSASRRVTEIGLVVGAIGGATVLIGGGLPLIRRLAVPLGGLLLAAGLVLVLIAVRYGVTPYRHGK
jgi:hypothetical protein